MPKLNFYLLELGILVLGSASVSTVSGHLVSVVQLCFVVSVVFKFRFALREDYSSFSYFLIIYQWVLLFLIKKTTVILLQSFWEQIDKIISVPKRIARE